jgi:tetratricopeptide (TPR) repeat protein
VALNEDDLPSALTLFDRALAVHPEAPRAWIGKGLTLLAAGQVDAAAPALEKGAGIFGDHLGAWVAAGWAQFMRNDLAAARRDFEAALAHDENFAELHGGLAVIDLVEGDIEGAKRRTDIAQRLDRNCFGAALARILLLELEGKPEQAGKIRDRMLNLPVGLDGRTLAQSVIGIGMKPDGRLQ